MTTSRNHQEAKGLGQIEEQLDAQDDAAQQIQGASKTDQEVQAAANRNDSELDEIIDT